MIPRLMIPRLTIPRLVIPWLVMALTLLAAPAVATEFWEGSYDCAQGRTGLTLTVEEAGSPDSITALFNFYAVPENPGVPAGCYEMAGVLDQRTRLLDLRAGRWLLRPFNYVTVDMRGTFDADFTRLTGRIAGPGCTGFELRRVAAPTHLPPAACRPAALTS